MYLLLFISVLFKFQNVNGLTKSSPVFADGFRVGIVRDLYYDYTQPGKVVAEIDVDPELRIPKGSTAELAAEMLGGVKMNLLRWQWWRSDYYIEKGRLAKVRRYCLSGSICL